jgi:hypothetical protein
MFISDERIKELVTERNAHMQRIGLLQNAFEEAKTRVIKIDGILEECNREKASKSNDSEDKEEESSSGNK